MQIQFEDELQLVQQRPLPKEAIFFFRNHKGHRVFVSISKPSVWKQDLAIAEKTSTTFILIPTDPVMKEELSTVRKILKDRFRYPGVKEDPALMEIAKTWVLSSKVLEGPDLTTFEETFATKSCQDFLASFNLESKYLCALKLELEDGAGHEADLLRKLLDAEWAPGLLLVKWSKDRQDDCLLGTCSCGRSHPYEYLFLKEHAGYCLYVYLSPSAKNAVEWWRLRGTYQSVLGKMIETLKEQKLGWLNLIADSWAQTS